MMVDGARLVPGMAAFANGVILNALGQEETHAATSTHPAETTVPLVLALAEERGSSGREVLDAVIVGMQVTMGLGAMELMPTIRYEICQAPSVLGTVGAAAAAARLCQLDEAATTRWTVESSSRKVTLLRSSNGSPESNSSMNTRIKVVAREQVATSQGPATERLDHSGSLMDGNNNQEHALLCST